MDKKILVATDFTIGTDLLEALDRSPLRISVALWVYFEEYEDWRFLLAAPRLDEAEGSRAFGLVYDAFSLSGITFEQTPMLMILRMSNLFIRVLRRLFSKAKSVEGMRLGKQLIGDRYVEDALVYRIR